jgi:hypothetical protein
MRSVIIIVAGLVLLAIFVLAGRWFGGGPSQPIATAAKLFLPLWIIVAAINMWIGVSRAGYSVAEELPVFLVIAGIPAVAAAAIWWKLS